MYSSSHRQQIKYDIVTTIAKQWTRLVRIVTIFNWNIIQLNKTSADVERTIWADPQESYPDVHFFPLRSKDILLMLGKNNVHRIFSINNSYKNDKANIALWPLIIEKSKFLDTF